MLTCAGVAIVAACGGNGGGTGSGSASDTTGATTTTSGPDPEPCDAVRSCMNDEQCCEGLAAGGQPPSVSCPSENYPYNWSCENNICVHGGCLSDSDCSQLFTGLTCMSVGNIGQCVAPCANDSDCTDDAVMPGTTCSGLSDQNESFCVQPTA